MKIVTQEKNYTAELILPDKNPFGFEDLTEEEKKDIEGLFSLSVDYIARIAQYPRDKRPEIMEMLLVELSKIQLKYREIDKLKTHRIW